MPGQWGSVPQPNSLPHRGVTLFLPGWSLKRPSRGFPAGPGVKNPPANTGDTDSISDPGTKIPHAMGQPSP